MFQLDEKFLEEVGLDILDQDQKKPFLQHIYNELEMRVGNKLSEGLSEEQIYEFEKIIDRDSASIMLWIANNTPNYYNDPMFNKLQSITGLDHNDSNLRAEYAATKWLELNRPNYKMTVMNVITEIKSEIIANKDIILGDV